MSSHLTLVPPSAGAAPVGRTTDRSPVAAGDVAAGDVAAGDRVHVPEPVTLPSGRRLRRGAYEVLQTLPGRRVIVLYRPDCSRLPRRFQEPGSPAREPALAVLDPGQFTAYADGDGPATLPDHPLQTD